jgi:hypothetical protein
VTRYTLVLVASLALFAGACNKKGEGGGGKDDGLPWKPIGLEKLTPSCRKALECCEALVTLENAKATAEDYNQKCSGPALWKDEDCAMDMKSRVSLLEDKKQPVPDACK